jgi:hypothetical protein
MVGRDYVLNGCRMFDKANKLAGKMPVFISTGIGGFLLLLGFL